MKEIIKKKMDEHVEKILAKEEISNEEYFLLCSVLQKIEGEEAFEGKFDENVFCGRWDTRL